MTVPALAEGVRHFFGTRHDAGPKWRATVVSVKQVHGTEVLVLDRPLRPNETFPGGWDALVTDQPRLLLTVRTADCVPVLMHDPDRGVVAAVHVGWRGAVAGIVPKTVTVLRRRFASKAASLRIGIGPSIGVCCYEVDEPVLERVRACRHDWRSVVKNARPGRAMLDLRAMIHRQLLSAGVAEEQIRTVEACTACDPERFYSYRRDGTVDGTMVSGIMLTKSREA